MTTGGTTRWGGTGGHSRRRLLRTAALLTLGTGAAATTGCSLFGGTERPDPAADPLAPLLVGALDLAARHRAAVTATPALAARLDPIAEAHRAHAAELARLLGGSPGSASPTPTAPAGDPTAVLAALREAEQRGREAAATACAEAPGERAALLGSIAAARATHVEALK